MKNVLLFLIIALNVSAATSGTICTNDSFRKGTYTVDSLEIYIYNDSLDYRLSFKINDIKMKCYAADLTDEDSKEYEIVLKDSADIYSGLKEFVIERNNIYDLFTEYDFWLSGEPEYIHIHTSVFLNGHEFCDRLDVGDIYSDKVQSLEHKVIVYSQPFRKFMRDLDKKAINRLGGGTKGKYKKMMKKIKKEHPENILIKT